MSDLFDTSEIEAAGKARIDEMRKKYNIKTQKDSDGVWMSFSLPEVRTAIDDDEIKDDASFMDVYSEYAFILDEYSLADDGFATEYEAISYTFNRLEEAARMKELKNGK